MHFMLSLSHVLAAILAAVLHPLVLLVLSSGHMLPMLPMLRMLRRRIRCRSGLGGKRRRNQCHHVYSPEFE
jgi:hypothetical protein